MKDALGPRYWTTEPILWKVGGQQKQAKFTHNSVRGDL